MLYDLWNDKNYDSVWVGLGCCLVFEFLSASYYWDEWTIKWLDSNLVMGH